MLAILDRFGRRLVKGVLLLSLASLIAGALGRYSPELDLFANARGHLLGLFAFAVLALWLDYRPVLVLALGTFITLAGHALLAQQNEGPLFDAALAAASSQPGDWTVLSLNTDHKHSDSAGLADYLMSTGADLLVLTEFGPNKIAEFHQLERLYPYRVDCATDWDCSIAVLSRHPFTTAGSTPEGAGPAMAWITFGQGDQALTIIGTEIVQPLRSPVLHTREMAHLAAFAKEFKGRVLVAGDLNTTPWSSSFARFGEASGLTHMGHFLPTFPSGTEGLPQLALDHMFASPGIHFDEVWIGPDVGAAHRPLFAEVQVPNAKQAALH